MNCVCLSAYACAMAMRRSEECATRWSSSPTIPHRPADCRSAIELLLVCVVVTCVPEDRQLFSKSNCGHKFSNCVTESMRTITTATTSKENCIFAGSIIIVNHLQRIHRPFAYRTKLRDSDHIHRLDSQNPVIDDIPENRFDCLLLRNPNLTRRHSTIDLWISFPSKYF